MKFDPIIAGTQIDHYGQWRIVHSPALSVDWLCSLLDQKIPDSRKDEQVLKLGKQNLVLKLDSDLGILVAKLYRQAGFNQKLRGFFKINRAQNSWYYAHYLLNQGFKTPEPLAYIEKRGVGRNKQAWYICRFQGDINCIEYFLHSPSFTPAMVNTASAIVDMFIQLRNCQLSHGNFNASNLLIADNMPVLLDLDTMRYHNDASKALQLWQRDIADFMNNWRERYDIHKQFQQAFMKRKVFV